MTSPIITRIPAPLATAAAGPAAGVTLIELLVVLAIIAITASIVAPYASGSHHVTTLRQAGWTFAKHVRFAQALAVNSSCPTRVSLNFSERSYRVEVASNITGAQFKAVSGLPQSTVVLPEGISFKRQSAFGLSEEQDTFRFDPGREWSIGRIWLTDGERSCLIELRNGLGRVDVAGIVKADEAAPGAEYAELLDRPL